MERKKAELVVEMMKRRIITLCGSIRFKTLFEEVNAELTSRGWIVLAPGIWQHSLLHDKSPARKIALDTLHFDKIEISRAIFVIDSMGYIGESTMGEIAFARECRKHVFYWSKGDLFRL